MKKVLVSDNLSDQGIAVFQETEGIDVDVKVGLKPEELKAIIHDYDGLAVRSATKATKEIIEAARWAPSVHNIQPWRFVVISKQQVILKIAQILYKKSKEVFSGFNIILKESAKIIKNSPMLIIVVNSCALSRRMKKFENPYFDNSKISEYQSIAAAIENILISAHSKKLGVAWIGMALFCKNE